MSLFEMHYVSKDSAQARIKQQQQQIHDALKQLSIKTRLEQIQEHEKLISGHHLMKSSTHAVTNNNLNKKQSMWYLLNEKDADEENIIDRPFSPYDIQRSAPRISSTASTSHSNSYYPSRQRTPSMTSTLSSALSENTTTTSLDSDGAIRCKKEEEEEEQFQLTDRDDYGFKRPFQWVNREKLVDFEKRYAVSKEQQKRRWRKLLLEHQQQWPPMGPQLSRYARKGVAPNLRSKAWFHYSGAYKKLKENPGEYQSCLEAAQQENKDSIKKDVHRTFPDNIHFASSSNNTCNSNGQESLCTSLYRVLSAFSQYAPDIGYCQSLNFLAGLLLLIFDNEEEKVFWMLVTIVRDYFPAKMFDKTMEGGNLEQTTFMLSVYDKMPGIWSKISNKKCFWECEQKDDLPPITLVTNHWFLTMFINILPVETVLRLWDCFFLGEGFTIIYRVALTILKLNERHILAAKDSTDVFPILQNTPKRMIDCDEFMKCVFSPQNNVASTLTTHDINSNREVCRKRKIQRKLNQLQLASIQL